MTEIDFTQLMVLLAWLAGPAGAMAWMVFLSNMVRNWRTGDVSQMDPYSSGVAGWIRRLTSVQLQTLVTVMAFAVPSIAAGILKLVPADKLAAAQEYWSFFAMLFLLYLGQQIWFQITKEKVIELPPAANQVVNIMGDAPKEPSTDGMIADLVSDKALPQSASTFQHPMGRYRKYDEEYDAAISFPGKQTPTRWPRGARVLRIVPDVVVYTTSSWQSPAAVFEAKAGAPFRREKKIA